ncbi:uncharacterized protein V1516DRAFT_625295 [Lipomyces oligophaga]|uniref:uncharacterized protein n=1 Tax=Lipomyces oligophaga TaxID=45792 RepID=UPI0034CF9A6F
MSIVKAEDLLAIDFLNCFELQKLNMMQMYKLSSLGWSSTDKLLEMKEQGLIYILLKAKAFPDPGASEKVVGFISFKATWENEEPVVYCYELQLRSQLRNFGLGRYLLDIIESFGSKSGLPKCMLTVFGHNPAYEFYQRLGYTPTSFSPKPTQLRKRIIPPSYWILEKALS